MYQLIITWYLLYAAPAFADLHLIQGEWQLTITSDGKPIKHYERGFVVTIRGLRITSADKDENIQEYFAENNEVGLNRFAFTPWSKPKTFYVMWCEGIYEVSPGRFRCCVKYHGQGVEGEAARNWKAPVDFLVREGQQHQYWTFERIKK